MKASSAHTGQLSPIAFSVNEVANLSGCSRTTIYEAINSGSLLARKLGNRTIIIEDDLRAWLNSLPMKEVM